MGASYAHADVIVDNGGGGTSSTGVWQASAASGSYGSKSVWARDGAKYTWTFTPAATGLHDTYMWWTEYSSRSASIPVSIAHAGGATTVHIDQQVNGGQWNLLGTFSFTAGQSYKVVITSQSSPTSTCADAVKFESVDGGMNMPPVAMNDAASTTEGTAVVVNVVSNDTDDGGVDASTVVLVGAPANGSAVSNGDGTVTYTPDVGFTGSDTFTYTVADSAGLASNAAMVTATVNAVSSEYVIDNGGAGTSFTGIWQKSGATGSYGTASVWARGGARYTWSFTPAASGIHEISMWWTEYSSRAASIPVDITHAGGTNRVYIDQRDNGARWNVLGRYEFTAGQNYTVVITSQASPTSTCADAVRFTYLMEAENLPPTAVNDAASTSMNTPVTFSVVLNDTDDGGAINAGSVTIVGQPANGAAVSNGNGTVTYTPDEDSTGPDTFIYTVADSEGLASNPATVTVTVTAGNTSPTAVNDTAVTSESMPVTIDVMHNDTDDGTINLASVMIVSPPTAGTAVSNGNGTVTYKPEPGVTGADTFKYTIADTQGMVSNQATVTVTINAGSPPVMVDTGNPGTSSTGIWAVSGASGSYGSNSLWARGGATYTWSFTPSAAGTYDVSMWWTEYSSRSTSIPVDITHAGGTSRIYINQQVNGGRWNILGSFSYLAGVTYTVKITSQASPTSTCADAVMFSYGGDVGNLPPTAVIDSISPNPAQPGQTVAFAGHGSEIDGGEIFAFNWRSSIDGFLSASESFTKSNLSTGQHMIYFKVQDDSGAWSAEASTRIDVTSQALTTEHIYVALMYGAENRKSEYISAMESLGAYQEGSAWKYSDLSTGMTYIIHFVTSQEEAKQALYTENAHVLLHGHANYGLGGLTLTNNGSTATGNVYYIDDDRFWNYSTKTFGISVGGMIKKQAYPNWWPEYKDGTSGISPYDFNDPRGNPPYNYYITYKIPGDPVHYKIETVRNGAVERFAGSEATPWYSADGSVPSASDPAHTQYFITNTEPAGDYGNCGASPCPKPHYGYRTILERKDLEIDPAKLKYRRLMLHSCSSLTYFVTNFTRGIVFYTLENVDGAGGPIYVKGYLQGKNDQEIWQSLLDYQSGYDYYDFNKKPSEQ